MPEGGMSTREFVQRAGLTDGNFYNCLDMLDQVALFQWGWLTPREQDRDATKVSEGADA
jgi:hypothetical protein